ncbi:radical SAM/CxCxxxxC motif protein YfkAB [Solibacillus sp. FSL K6-1523]|uniref:radical SAM/CxCxxxxC motif protein YfkAB n=1 Tax=Solibacillus sp. FSL K6-1523 TaxID=2921471 RepID=UPI0030F7F49F
MTTLTKITPSYDPWEAYLDIEKHGQMTLSNIEFTTTNLCNMRCAHCAVGYTLQTKDPDALPIELLIQRLDEIPHLQTLSITGGEPMMSKKSIQNYVLPLLKYAHKRGVRTQMNSNLTMDGARYLEIAPYLDVLHISHNWGTIEEFVETGFAMMDRKPTVEQRAALFQRMIDNSKMLAENGVMVSAETMLNKKTLPYLDHIHRQIVEEMKCARHEIHPMYPSDFASTLSSLSLEETREAIHQILDARDENTWMLFGTLPFYPCSSNEEDQKLLQRLREAKNVTLRNDPDGRSRLNINIFTGEVIVTDFGDTPALGNIQNDSLPAVFDKWLATDIAKSLNCHCPAVKCLGPNVLVKNMYYQDEAFISGSAK